MNLQNRNRPKVVWWIDHLGHGGSQESLIEITQGLATRVSHQTVVVLNNVCDPIHILKLKQIGVNVRILGKWRLMLGIGLVETWWWLRKEKFDADWDFENRKGLEPTVPPIKYKDVTKGVPHLEKPITTKLQHYYGGIGSQLQPTGFGPEGDKTWGEAAEKGIKRGGIWSAIGGGLKKIGKTIFGDNPFDIALNLLTLGGYEKAKYVKAILNARKKGTISNRTLKTVQSLLGAPKKAGDTIGGKDLSGLISGKENVIAKGMSKYAGLSEDEIKAAKLAQGVAHGGRIDKPLMGRNRYI